ncbi:MAG: 2-C-methyl-D-erythritol 4-phosphate cytidylyltransferase [Ignavibacteria bacterium]|nr:2-C-methyl-D-erythritol 4-phosphate cytidylyltransferase [Ignavibacteria bacterium]
MRFHLIIPSSGTGMRFGSRLPKQYFKIGGNEIIAFTISKFINIKEITSIYISARQEQFRRIEKLIIRNNFNKKEIFLTEGGETRQHSVFNALNLMEYNNNEYVMVHDAVRPYVTTSLIRKCMKEAVQYNCAVPCVSACDTVKISGKNLFITETIPRENIFLAQTPQIFRLDILKKSYNNAFRKAFRGTDDSSVVEFAGYKVKIVKGEKENIKITSKSDINDLL